MAVLNYALYELVLKLHPNGSAEAIKNEYNRQLKIINEIENAENNNLLIPAIEATAQPVQDSKMKKTRKKKTEADYITYKKEDLKHHETDKFLTAKYIKCCLCDDKDPEEMRDLTRHLYDKHKCSPQNYIDICGYKDMKWPMCHEAHKSREETIGKMKEGREKKAKKKK